MNQYGSVKAYAVLPIRKVGASKLSDLATQITSDPFEGTTSTMKAS